LRSKKKLQQRQKTKQTKQTKQKKKIDSDLVLFFISLRFEVSNLILSEAFELFFCDQTAGDLRESEWADVG